MGWGGGGEGMGSGESQKLVVEWVHSCLYVGQLVFGRGAVGGWRGGGGWVAMGFDVEGFFLFLSFRT